VTELMEGLSVLPVHVTNPGDLKSEPVRQTPSEHVSTQNIALNTTGTPSQVLGLDPRRERAVLSMICAAANASVLLCDSMSQATRALAGAQEGFLVALTQNVTSMLELKNSAPLWAVPVAGAAITVSSFIEREA